MASLQRASLQQASIQRANFQKTTVVTLVLATCLSTAAFAETKKEYRFTVGPNANISVDTQYGAISVQAGQRQPGRGNGYAQVGQCGSRQAAKWQPD